MGTELNLDFSLHLCCSATLYETGVYNTGHTPYCSSSVCLIFLAFLITAFAAQNYTDKKKESSPTQILIKSNNSLPAFLNKISERGGQCVQ